MTPGQAGRPRGRDRRATTTTRRSSTPRRPTRRSRRCARGSTAGRRDRRRAGGASRSTTPTDSLARPGRWSAASAAGRASGAAPRRGAPVRRAAVRPRPGARVGHRGAPARGLGGAGAARGGDRPRVRRRPGAVRAVHGGAPGRRARPGPGSCSAAARSRERATRPASRSTRAGPGPATSTSCCIGDEAMAAWEPEAFYLPGREHAAARTTDARDIASPRLEQARARGAGRRPGGPSRCRRWRAGSSTCAPGSRARRTSSSAADAGPRSHPCPTADPCASSRTTSGSAAAAGSRSSAPCSRRWSPTSCCSRRRRTRRTSTGSPGRPGCRTSTGGRSWSVAAAHPRAAARPPVASARPVARLPRAGPGRGAADLRLLGLHLPAGPVGARRAGAAAERGHAAGVGGRRGRRQHAARGRPQLRRARRRPPGRGDAAVAAPAAPVRRRHPHRRPGPARRGRLGRRVPAPPPGRARASRCRRVEPQIRLDYVLVPPQLLPVVTVCAPALDAPLVARASDHLPLVTVLGS